MSALKLLSWNIRQGGGTRLLSITQSLSEHQAHVLVLSEFRNNHRGERLRKSLTRLGYEHQAVTPAPEQTNSVIIASVLPFETTLLADRVEVFPDAVIRAEFDAFDLYGMYLPHKKKHTWFDVLLEEVAKDKPAILAGDMNSGKNGIDQAGKSFWYEDKLFALEDLGYVDAFRHAQGDVREFSWFSHQGNGYRYDHTYVDKDLLPLIDDCYYSHKEREEKISDHSVMLLDLKAK